MLFPVLKVHMLCYFRGGRGGGSGGPTRERAVKRKAPKTKRKTAKRGRAPRRTLRKRTTATKITRWSDANGDAIETERDENQTPQPPQTTIYLQTTTPANTAGSQANQSWWVLTDTTIIATNNSHFYH